MALGLAIPSKHLNYLDWPGQGRDRGDSHSRYKNWFFLGARYRTFPYHEGPKRIAHLGLRPAGVAKVVVAVLAIGNGQEGCVHRTRQGCLGQKTH
jgi:hypothetical protein